MPGDKNATEDRIDKDREFALRLAVAQSRIQQELYLDTIADGALSAAQQVQDKRLDLLEAGPEVNASNIFVDILISVALGPVAGVALNGVTKAIFAKILSSRAASPKPNLIAEPQMIELVSELNPKVITNARMKAENVKREFPTATGTEQYELYQEFVRDTLGVGPDVLKDRAKDAALRNDKSVPSKEETGSDSAGVALTDSVQQFARRHKAAVNLVHDRLDLELQRGINQETAKELRLLLKENLSKLPNDISTAKEQYKLLFEACIWVSLIKGTPIWEKVTDYIFLDPAPMPIPAQRTRQNAPDKLIDYWIKRFPHPGCTFNVGPRSPVFDKSFSESEELKHRSQKELALQYYFTEIGNNLRKGGGLKTERLIPKSQ